MVIVMKMGEAFGLTHFFLIITIHQTGGPGGYSGDCPEGKNCSVATFFVQLLNLILIGCFIRPYLVKIEVARFLVQWVLKYPSCFP